MKLERALIRIAGPACVFFGLVCAVAPQELAALAGISATPAGTTDLRAIYGGFQLGLGGFLLWCGRDEARYRAGLLALGCITADVAIVRSIGMFVDGDPTGFLLVNLALEVSIVALVATALFQAQRRSGAVFA